MNQAVYLDEVILESVKRAAEKDKVSVDVWLRDAVQRKLETWPEAVTSLAGAWRDFPEREDLKELPKDLPRETL